MHGFPRRAWLAAAAGVAVGAVASGCAKRRSPNSLLNVSYDPTRELYVELNDSFIKAQKGKRPVTPEVKQSHGGSGKQARAVIDGLEADVVTLALGYDIDEIAKAGLIKKDWQERLPNKSSPYTSTVVFLVRKGNPKKILDWDDLAKDGVEIITPNPKTSGGARWNYLAAWGSQLRKSDGSDASAEAYVKKLFSQVPVLDSGARGATTTFVERKIGDVLLAWENEALLAAEKLGSGEVEVVAPPSSILAEPPVAVVDKIVDKHASRELATAYLEHLYTDEGQSIIAKNYFRPRSDSARSVRAFTSVETYTIDDVFGGWDKAHAAHFADGATFDKLYQPK